MVVLGVSGITVTRSAGLICGQVEPIAIPLCSGGFRNTLEEAIDHGDIECG